MDDERRAKINAALHRYRETVTQHNLSLVRTLVQLIEALPPPRNCSETTARILRVRELDRYLGGSISTWIKSPRDLLNDDIHDELIERAGLDGVHSLKPDLEAREKYFAAVRARILGLDVEVAEFPPADLAYLCTLVDGITGPGLPYNRVSQQIEFISRTGEGLERDVGVPVRFDENEAWDESAGKSPPYDQLSFVWLDWEMAVAVQIGHAPFTGGSFAVYCRKEENEQWKWRYGVHDGDWCSDLYGTVEEFLDYYAHFREQTEDDIRRDVRGLVDDGPASSPLR